MSEKKIITYYTKYNKRSASVRERFYRYIPILKKNDFDIKLIPLIDDDLFKSRIIEGKKFNLLIVLSVFKRIFNVIYQKKNLVIIQYELLPYFPPVLEYYLHIRKIPYIIDIDDAIFHYYDKSDNFFINFLYKKKFHSIFSNAKSVFTGNDYLYKQSKKFGSKKSYIFPTLVDIKKKKVKKKNNKFTVVWIGSPSTTKYLNDIKKCIENIARIHNINFWIIGSKNCSIKSSVNIKFFKWNLESQDKMISKCHVGIMPLRNTFWEKGKCGYKLLQYMKNELPVLASPVGINKNLVNHGSNGYLIKNEKEWEKYILKLKNNFMFSKKMGLNGRKKILSKFNIEFYGKKYLEIIKEIQR